jgi:4-amino-4-deoxy-L-arabinose transferase-like glycosyltransferase
LCVSLFQFCRLHGKARAGCFASVGLASAVPVVMFSHVVLLDPLLTALLGTSLLCFLHSYLARSRRAHLAAACLLGLAVLEKGAVALVLAGGSVGMFLLLMRDRNGWRHALDPVALAIVFVVAAPWHLAAALRQDGFTWFYFVNEHLLRFLGRREPQDYHHGPLWFYLPRLLLMLLPWTPFLLLLARRTRPVPELVNRTMVKFCQAALLFPLLFFSLSQAKADYYLLVTAPALALWLALGTVPRLERADHLLARCWGIAAASLLVLLVAVSGSPAREWTPWSAALLLLAGAALASVGTRVFAQLRCVRARECAMLGVVLLAAPALVLLYRAANERGAHDSSWYIARLLQAQAPRAVFLYRDFEDVFSTLPFYLGHPVPLIDSASRDLFFGCKAAPGSYCVSAAQFRRLARAPVAVVVLASRAEEFRSMAGPGGWRVEWVGDKMVFFNAK